MAKRNINRAEIEARYKAGEQPADIAKDYKCCTSAAIRSMAYRGKWLQQRDEIRDEIVTTVLENTKNDVIELCSLDIKAHLNFLRKLLGLPVDENTMIAEIMHPFLFDGEKVNGLFQTAMNNSTKIALQYMKQKDEQEPEHEVVLRLVDPDGRDNTISA